MPGHPPCPTSSVSQTPPSIWDVRTVSSVKRQKRKIYCNPDASGRGGGDGVCRSNTDSRNAKKIVSGQKKSFLDVRLMANPQPPPSEVVHNGSHPFRPTDVFDGDGPLLFCGQIYNLYMSDRSRH